MQDNIPKGLHLLLKRNLEDKEYLKIPSDGEFIFSAKTGYDFVIYIKEHQEEIDVLNEEIEKAKEKYNNLQNEYLSGKKTKVTDDANRAVRDKRVAEVNDKIKKVNDKYKDVVYIWSLVGTSLNLGKNDYNKSLRSGYTGPIKMRFGELIRGGGKSYLEAFYKDENPILNASNGIYFSSLDTPEIIRIEWTDSQDKIIEGNVKDGSYVFLHIYTKNLYGHKLKVQLMDNDHAFYDSDDKLSNKNDSDPQKEDPILYSVNADVDLYKVTQIDQHDSSLGNLVEGTTSIKNVQKAILRVRVDPLIYTAGSLWGTNSNSKWKSEGGTNLEIYPIVTTPEWDGSQQYSMKGNYLKVDYDNTSAPSYDIPNYKSPIKIGQVTTNIAEFHSCGYNTIIVSDDDRSVAMFDKGKTDLIKSFDLLAGKITKRVTIKLDDTASTNSCDGKGNGGETHANHVFEIIGFSDQSNSADNKPEVKDDKNDSKWSAKTEVEIGVGSVSSKNTTNYSFNNGRTGIVEPKNDKEVVLSLNYKYNTSLIDILGIVGLPSMLRYIWVGEDYLTQDYKVVVSSCRYLRHQFAIKVYPDVSWALFLSYKNEEDDDPSKKKELISNQTYSDTRQAHYHREKAEWIKVGDKILKINLVAKSNYNGDDSDETDISADVKKLFEKITAPINAVLELFEDILSGDNNGPDSGGGDTTEAQNAVNTVNNTSRQDQELAKIQDRFKENRRKLNSKDEVERRQARAENRRLQRAMDKQSKGKSTRSLLTFELSTPQFEVGLGWRRVPITNTKYSDLLNSTGMLVEGSIAFDPLIKVAIALDFLALAQRANPIALAVIAAIDIALQLTGDGSELTLSLTVTGTIGGKLTGFINTLTGENTFTAKDKNSREEAFAEIKGELEFEFKANIKIKFEKRVVFIIVGETITKVEVEAGIKANAVFSAKAILDSDKEGLFIDPELGFDGVKFEGKASAKAEFNVSRRNKPSGSVKVEGTIAYQAIDKQDPIKIGKTYLMRN